MNLLHHHTQCPKCQLRFANRAELQWHLREDHPEPRTPTSDQLAFTVERARPAAPPEHHRRRLWEWLRTDRPRG